MANLYSFIGAQEITVFIPPNSSVAEMQVTARALESGVTFLAQFPKDLYKQSDSVRIYLNELSNSFNSYAKVPGVDAIAAVQEIDTNNQLEDKIDVTVTSTSGKSSMVVRTDYPLGEFGNITLENFVTLVEATRAELDAVEAG